MALLNTLIRKHGPEAGREKYNEWHRNYRERNKTKMLKYWKKRRKAQKASVSAASGL